MTADGRIQLGTGKQQTQRKCCSCGKDVSGRIAQRAILSADRIKQYVVCSDKCSAKVCEFLNSKNFARDERKENPVDALLRELGIQ